MTATVLVPLDGSDKDERAFPVAVALAHLTDGAVHVIRVLDDASPSLRYAAERSVRAAADHLAPSVRQPATWEVADGPDVAAVLVRRAAEVGADVVVMATRGAGALGRAIHGSVADRVVRESSRPVVLVPPGADFLGGKQVRMRRVLVPLDGSAAALEVLACLLAFPRTNELEVVLLEVVAPAPDHGDAAQAERRLEGVADRVRARGAAAEVRVVEAGDPAAVIVGAVRQELADFIAMTTRGASGIERLVLGSVATGVVRKSEVPVLLVTPA